MSDFFTRLAARTLGLVPTLQPIIAPLFAQEQFLQAADTGPFEFFAEETSSHNGGAKQQDSHPQPQRALSQISPVSSPENSQHDRQDHLHVGKDQQTPMPMQKSLILEQVAFQKGSYQDKDDRQASQGDSHTVIPEQQAVSMQVSSTSVLLQNPMPTTTHETSIIHEEMTSNTITQNQKEALIIDNTGRHHTPEIRLVRSLPPIERNAVVPLIPENVGPPLAVGLSAVDDDAVHHMPVPSSTKHVGTSLAVGYDTAGRGMTNHGTLGYVPVNQPPIQPPPSISVTIGRVEVRATSCPSPAVPARATPAPAVKSLDDYVRQREEGRVR